MGLCPSRPLDSEPPGPRWPMETNHTTLSVSLTERPGLASFLGHALTMDSTRNFRFGLQTRASYASPALDTTNLPPERAPVRSAAFRRLVFARLTSPACCRVIDSQTLLRPSSLGPRFCNRNRSATRSAPAAPRSAAASGQTGVDADALGQQQPIIAGMLDQPPTSLDQPLLQARQRPGVDSLRQHQTAPQIAQVLI